jgi:CRISPR-associated protein Cas6
MSVIDIHFPVRGDTLPTDHAYDLYSALSRIVPALHCDRMAYRLAAITGEYAGNGSIRLWPQGRSRLRLRLMAEDITTILPLAGGPLDIGGKEIRLGVPAVQALVPAPALVARSVVIAGFTDPGPFLDAARRQLDELKIVAEIGIPLNRSGPREGQPRRCVIRLKGARMIGYPVQVEGLTADESIRLQEAGIGGRGHLGCGFFIPLRPSRI